MILSDKKTWRVGSETELQNFFDVTNLKLQNNAKDSDIII
jgi:hypothetical protein